LHHVVLERWSRGTSVLHRRDPRAKTIALLAFLVVVATTPTAYAPYLLLWYAVLPLCAILAGRLPVAGVLARAAVVLPFCAVFAVTTALAGDVQRAAALVEKSYLSALAALAVAGTTPVPRFLRGMEALGAPRFLLWVVHFLHRYLFVVSEQAQHMRLAAASRGSTGGVSFRRWRVRAATGALAVLFAKSYGRAEATYRAMLSRGFQGRLQLLDPLKLNWGDYLLIVLGVSGPAGLKLALVFLV
jgi:cobalt/nickel transport system permease protein